MAAMADLNEERRPPTPNSPLEYEVGAFKNKQYYITARTLIWPFTR